jgi:ABC-type microcin C transport system duplicated ATPase subunit YejF
VPPLIAIEEVSRVFTSGARTVLALDNVSFEIHAGNFVSIVGPERLWQEHFAQDYFRLDARFLR